MSKEYNKALSNERIIAALMNYGTVTAAAEAMATTPRTIYTRMKEKEFKAMYADAKADLIRQSAQALNKRIAEAAETICGIMKNEDNPPAVRLQAAQAILNQAGKFSDRLQAAEYAIDERNKFSLLDL